MPRRENSGRHGSQRAPHRTILVYCGGARTERDYFNGLQRSLRRSGLTVKSKGVAPEELVRTAAAYRDRFPGVYDEVWCVVDVDQFDIAAAVAAARREGINLAVSNPCFELWLLLHHADCHGYCNGCIDTARQLRQHVSTYDKTGLDFADFSAGVEAATKRARNLEPTGAEHTKNPSTSVWRLVERLGESPPGPGSPLRRR